jgi:hypothetical protein
MAKDVDALIAALLDMRPIRVPLRYQGDEGFEWRGESIIDYDRAAERWRPELDDLTK